PITQVPPVLNALSTFTSNQIFGGVTLSETTNSILRLIFLDPNPDQVTPLSSQTFNSPGATTLAALANTVANFRQPLLQEIYTISFPEFDQLFTGGSVNASIDISAGPSPIPLPAALPLFATGLGALGLLGWRRKKKAAALAA